jgi:hypothetical protein
VIDLGEITDDGVRQMTPQDVLDVRALIVEAGAVNCRSNRLAQAMVDELELPDTVLVVKVICLVADTPSAVKRDIASSAASSESVPTKPHTNPESLDGPLLREAEAMPAADPVLSPTDKHAGRDPRRSRPPKEETVESTLGRFDLRLIETRTGWAAIHGVKVIGHYSLKAEATHCALNHALSQLREGTFL